uniref:Uncharacterized protein n=1 Tax=Cacopsylla melanoneura TaxID=428564 RepID=A0A8D8R523_9HEMI
MARLVLGVLFVLSSVFYTLNLACDENCQKSLQDVKLEDRIEAKPNQFHVNILSRKRREKRRKKNGTDLKSNRTTTTEVIDFWDQTIPPWIEGYSTMKPEKMRGNPNWMKNFRHSKKKGPLW